MRNRTPSQWKPHSDRFKAESTYIEAKQSRTKGKRNFRRFHTRCCVRLFLLIVSSVFFHEFLYFLVLHRLDVLPNYDTLATANTTDIAIASLHRGFKFAGYLGHWLDANKASYAAIHGYHYFNEDDFAKHVNEMESLSSWQSVYHRRVKFDKLRFLLYIMDGSLERGDHKYVLWMDGDAIVTNENVIIEDRIRAFRLDHQYLFAWASDGRPNTGVMLFRICAETRELLNRALHTWDVHQRYMDQDSFHRVVNRTYAKYQWLLQGKDSRQLQSRVRGSVQYRDGDWILHLPNHNRIELLYSLTSHLPVLGQWFQ